MKGFVAVTDPGWYKHLAQTPGPKDANFWRPSARAFRLEIGTPFFFKLKAPHHAIAGFGSFVGFTILPDRLAWDTFRESNGVASLEELRLRLSTIQEGARIRADPTGRIGCCLIAEARFFPREAWVAARRDWSPRTQTGEGYDLENGEGRRIWAECRTRAAERRSKLPGSGKGFSGFRCSTLMVEHARSPASTLCLRSRLHTSSPLQTVAITR